MSEEKIEGIEFNALSIKGIEDAIETLKMPSVKWYYKSVLNTTQTIVIQGNVIYAPKDLTDGEIKIVCLPETDLQMKVKELITPFYNTLK